MRIIALLLLLTSFRLSAQDDFEKAQKLFDARQYEQAAAICNSVLRQEPRHEKALECLGDINAIQKKWEIACGYYKKGLSANAKSADFHYKYGGTLAMIAAQNKLRALGMLGDIRSSFEKAIALDAKHIDARWALVEYYLQVPGIFGGSESKANKYADELAPLSAVDHYLAKGRVDEYFGRYEKAEKNYQKANQIGHSETTLKKLTAIRFKMKKSRK